MEACVECSRSCLVLHRTKLDPYPIVSSFFKVMFGNEFSEVLIVPPQFANTVKALEGQSTYLEDSTGQKWKVGLCNVNGSLAFQNGWHEFSVDHSIEVGDFLVFHHFKGSHFLVEIFGRSGCEKPVLFGGKNYQKTREKLSRSDPGPPNIVVNRKKDHLQNVKNSPETKRVYVPREDISNKRPKLAPTTDFLVESYFMTNRDVCFTREDDRSDLFDLSVFEMPEMKEDAGKRSYEISSEADRSTKERAEILNNTVSTDPMPLNVSMPIKSIASPQSEVSAPANSCGRTKIGKQEHNSDENVYVNSVADNLLCASAILSSIEKDPKLRNETLGRHSTSVEEDKGQKDMTVNPETPDLCVSSSAASFKITYPEQKHNEPFLVLPKPLPLNVYKQGEKLGQNLVVLRDPGGRLWPVIYSLRPII